MMSSKSVQNNPAASGADTRFAQLTKLLDETKALLESYRKRPDVDMALVTIIEKFIKDTLTYYQTYPAQLDVHDYEKTIKEQQNIIRQKLLAFKFHPYIPKPSEVPVEEILQRMKADVRKSLLESFNAKSLQADFTAAFPWASEIPDRRTLPLPKADENWLGTPNPLKPELQYMVMQYIIFSIELLGEAAGIDGSKTVENYEIIKKVVDDKSDFSIFLEDPSTTEDMLNQAIQQYIQHYIEFERTYFPRRIQFYPDPATAPVQPPTVLEALDASLENEAFFLQKKMVAETLSTNLGRVKKEKSALNSLNLGNIQQDSVQLQMTLQQELRDNNDRYQFLQESQEQLQKKHAELLAALNKKPSKADQERIQAEIAQIDARLLDVESNMSILMNEYELKAKKREALQRFNHHPNLLLFYRTVQIKLEDIFISMKAVSGGFVEPTQGNLAIAQSIVQNLGDVAAMMPIVGPIAEKLLKWTGIALGKVDNIRQKNVAQNASALVTLSEIKKHAESVARQLTESYAEQLVAMATLEEEQTAANRLQSGMANAKEKVFLTAPLAPVQQLASYAVLWMTDVIFAAKDIDPSSLDQLLLAQVTQKSPPDKIEGFWNEITQKLGLRGLRTKNEDSWKPAEVFTLPGVKVRTSQKDVFQYYSSTKLNPSRYGWRLGTLADIQSLKLSLVLTPTNTANVVEPAKETAQLKKAMERQADDIDSIKRRQERHDKGDNIIGGAKVRGLEERLAEEQRKNAALAKQIEEERAKREQQAERIRLEAREREERIRREARLDAERISRETEARIQAQFGAMQAQFAAMHTDQAKADPANLPTPSKTFMVNPGNPPPIPARPPVPEKMSLSTLIHQAIGIAFKDKGITDHDTYYHADITHEAAKSLLLQQPKPGLFLVRSGSPNTIVISYVNKRWNVEEIVLTQNGQKFTTPMSGPLELTVCFGQYADLLMHPLSVKPMSRSARYGAGTATVLF